MKFEPAYVFKYRYLFIYLALHSYRAERSHGRGSVAYEKAEGAAVAFRFAIGALDSFACSRCMYTLQSHLQFAAPIL